MAKFFRNQFASNDGGRWSPTRFWKAIASSLPWNKKDGQLPIFAEYDFNIMEFYPT